MSNIIVSLSYTCHYSQAFSVPSGAVFIQITLSFLAQYIWVCQNLGVSREVLYP